MRFDNIRALEVAAAGHHTVSLFGEGPVARLEQLAETIGVEVVGSGADITVEVPVVPEWMKGSPSEPHDRVMQRVSEYTRHDLLMNDSAMSLLRMGARYYSLTDIQAKQVASVALTIANLARAQGIHAAHVAEALQYVDDRN